MLILRATLGAETERRASRHCDLCGYTSIKGKRVLAKLQRVAQKRAAVGEVRGLGLMIGVELVSDRDAKSPDAAAAERAQDRMLEQGFLIGVGGAYGNVLRIQPPLVTPDEDLDRAVEALDDAFQLA